MGTWGTAFFSDDTACDIRDSYKDLIGDGYTPSEATDQILAECKSLLNDQDASSVIWCSLAVTQWKIGRLEERVKNEAIRIIDSGIDLERWEGNDRKKRKEALDKIRITLESPQPVMKKIPKRFRNHCDWGIGELIAYTTVSKKKVIFRVIGFSTDKGGTTPICELLNWQGEKIPGKFRLRFIGIRKKTYPHTKKYALTQFCLCRTSEQQLPADRVERLGIFMKPSQKAGINAGFSWIDLDRSLKENFDFE